MDFEARVAALAALADPARLRIVDVLDAGDASPGELRDQLAMSSNLIAHHLNVLEQAGVVSRHRSHADRRRTYLRLHRDRLSELLPITAPSGRPTVEGVERVVFVCTANSARSQLAAALWRQASSVPATSGGTHPGPAIAPGTVSAARRHGLRLVQEGPQSLHGLLRDGDYVVTVCDAAHEKSYGDEPPVRLAGVSHWSVPDPTADGSDEAFDAACVDIAGRVADLASRLSPRLDADAS